MTHGLTSDHLRCHWQNQLNATSVINRQNPEDKVTDILQDFFLQESLGPAGNTSAMSAICCKWDSWVLYVFYIWKRSPVMSTGYQGVHNVENAGEYLCLYNCNSCNLWSHIQLPYSKGQALSDADLLCSAVTKMKKDQSIVP